MRRFWASIALGVLLITGCDRGDHPGNIGKPAPPIAGTTIDGKPISVADSKGDVVLIVFWATWCIPNAQQAERLGVLEAALRGKGFRVVGINLDMMQDGGVAAE